MTTIIKNKLKTNKDSLIQVRIKSNTKSKVEKILQQLGMTTSQAITMFLTEVERTNRVPLSLDLSFKLNDELTQEIREARTIKGTKISNQKELNKFVDNL